MRDGERHPGLPDDGVLRGTSPEREPRPVVDSPWMVPLPWTDAPVTAGVLWSLRRGTPSACAFNAYAADARITHHSRSRSDDVLHSVQRPVRVERHYTPRRKPSEVARSRWHRGRASLRKAGGTDTGVVTSGRRAARPSSPLSGQLERGVAEQNRMVVMATLLARSTSSGLVARTS